MKHFSEQNQELVNFKMSLIIQLVCLILFLSAPPQPYGPLLLLIVSIVNLKLFYTNDDNKKAFSYSALKEGAYTLLLMVVGYAVITFLNKLQNIVELTDVNVFHIFLVCVIFPIAFFRYKKRYHEIKHNK